MSRTGPLLLLLLLLSTLSLARDGGLSVSQLRIDRSGGQWTARVAWRVPWEKEPFREVHEGVPIDFTVTFRVFRRRGWWQDDVVTTTRVQREVYYNRLTHQYRVIAWDGGDRTFTREWDRARQLVRKTGPVPFAKIGRLKGSEDYYLGVRVKARREQLSLPARMVTAIVKVFQGSSEWHYQALPP